MTDCITYRDDRLRRAGRPAHGLRPDDPVSGLAAREDVQILTTTRLASRRCHTSNDERGGLQGQR